jgi:hypothetical protein
LCHQVTAALRVWLRQVQVMSSSPRLPFVSSCQAAPPTDRRAST